MCRNIRTLLVTAGVSVAFLACSPTPHAEETPPPASGLAGTWTGSWIRDGDTLAIALHFEEVDGSWRGRFDSERLRVEGIPFTEVAFDPPQLRLRLAGDATTTELEGRLDGDSLNGTFVEGGAAGSLALTRSSAGLEVLREQDVRFRSGEVALAGTLVLPAGPGPHPAVVFLHGSGPEGRWASRFLALWLARHGYAALIWDKRGVGESVGSWEEAGFEELAADAAAAVAFARGHPEIQADRVGIHGHSQGGTIAPLVAVRSHADFVIASAAAGIFPDEVEIYSVGNHVGISSLPPEEATLAEAYVEAIVDVGYRDGSRERLEKAAEAADGYEWYFPPPGPDDPYWSFSQQIAAFGPLAWWREVDVPVLLLYGSKDERVPAERSRAAIVRAILRSGGARVQSRIFEGADHTFRTHSPGDVWPRTAEGYPNAILEWLEEHLPAVR